MLTDTKPSTDRTDQSLVERIVEALEGMEPRVIKVQPSVNVEQPSIVIEAKPINLQCEITSRDKSGYLKTFTIKSI